MLPLLGGCDQVLRAAGALNSGSTFSTTTGPDPACRRLFGGVLTGIGAGWIYYSGDARRRLHPALLPTSRRLAQGHLCRFCAVSPGVCSRQAKGSHRPQRTAAHEHPTCRLRGSGRSVRGGLCVHRLSRSGPYRARLASTAALAPRCSSKRASVCRGSVTRTSAYSSMNQWRIVFVLSPTGLSRLHASQSAPRAAPATSLQVSPGSGPNGRTRHPDTSDPSVQAIAVWVRLE